MTIKTLSGPEIDPYVNDLADLRIRVFRDFPYLYDGDVGYERRYLRKYAGSPLSLFVLAMDGDAVVGASTALPLSDADAEFKTPFKENGMDVDIVYYFGESVLDARYRGQGIGHRFFDERERFAADNGFSITTFCAVDRRADHPARPADYRPLDAFWNKRGYERRPDLVTAYAWKDIGEGGETEKRMVFWLRGQSAEGAHPE
jgi:GNAT superfamily N-acetyltransferase